MKRLRFFFIAALLGACSAPPACPTVTPFKSLLHSTAMHNGLDPDIARIFQGHATRKPPAGFKWAPDSTSLAFLETTDKAPDQTRLWVVDAVKRRKRPLFLGEKEKIVDFVWSTADALIVQTEQRVVKATLNGEIFDLVTDEKIVSAIQSLAISPDARFLSYRRESNLFLWEIEAATEIQLTQLEDIDQCAGCISWLYEEEFETSAGYGWSKDGSQLWFRQVDQRNVVKRTVDASTIGTTRTIPYAKAGEPNPQVKIGVISCENGTKDPGSAIRYIDAVADDNTYLPDVMWHPNGQDLLVTRMDRLQTKYELLQCDNKTLACETVFSHTDPRWVNYPGLPHFSPDSNFYAIALELGEFAHIHRFDSRSHQHRQLTDGSFQVFGIDAVSNDGVYFTANRYDPLSAGLYRVQAGDNKTHPMGEITPVNDTTGHHQAVYAPDSSLHVDTYSHVDASPSVHLCDATGAPLLRIDETEGHDYRPPKEIVNEFATIDNKNGDTLYIQVTRPKTPDKNKAYPALVYVYGGPRYQAVVNRYNTTFTAWRNLMAQRGIIVFTLDNRGSAGRGRTFETAIHRNLTEAALADQLTGVKWLRSQPYVAKKRIGILGWSFGGTMTLAALLKTEDTFKLGVAIAPVTDWRRYDSAYTERYMQRPVDNGENYTATDLTQKAAELSERLMIVHGTGDDNVLPENSLALINEFTQAGKQVELRLYPGAQHSISNPKSRAHLFSEITRFIEQYL